MSSSRETDIFARHSSCPTPTWLRCCRGWPLHKVVSRILPGLGCTLPRALSCAQSQRSFALTRRSGELLSASYIESLLSRGVFSSPGLQKTSNITPQSATDRNSDPGLPKKNTNLRLPYSTETQPIARYFPLIPFPHHPPHNPKALCLRPAAALHAG